MFHVLKTSKDINTIIIISISLIIDAVVRWYIEQPLEGQLSPKKCVPSHKVWTFMALKTLMRLVSKVFCHVIIRKNALKQLVCKAPQLKCDKIMLISSKMSNQEINCHQSLTVWPFYGYLVKISNKVFPAGFLIKELVEEEGHPHTSLPLFFWTGAKLMHFEILCDEGGLHKWALCWVGNLYDSGTGGRRGHRMPWHPLKGGERARV